MRPRQFARLVGLMASLVLAPLALSTGAEAADNAAVQAKEGHYRTLVDFDFVRQHVEIPPRKGVVIIDSRPAARQYDPGHIPGALNIPDSQFDKLSARLPEDKTTLLLFYCGGLDCMLSHNSAFKAEKLGYTNIRVYAAGMPDWKANKGNVAVSAAYLRKLADDKAPHVLIDARPKRAADKGMIPGAINIPDTEFDRSVDRLPADKATPMIFYCGGLDCLLSDKSADKARRLGYTNVMTYPPGYPEWEKLHGSPASAATAAASAAAAAPAASLIAGKEKGSVTVASFEQVWKADPSALMLVDVREPREYAAGTIKGAVNIPINDLEKKIASLPADKPVVFICGTGARSGEAYDTVKLLGGKVNVSFIDAEIKFGGDGTYTMVQK